jgi:hypothetical protein
MPADKYGYKPTEAQVPFGHWVSHATGANYLFCSKLTAARAPEAGVKETDPKDKLVGALKKSFDYCSTQLDQLGVVHKHIAHGGVVWKQPRQLVENFRS